VEIPAPAVTCPNKPPEAGTVAELVALAMGTPAVAAALAGADWTFWASPPRLLAASANAVACQTPDQATVPADGVTLKAESWSSA
jgi:hypothetical protein